MASVPYCHGTRKVVDPLRTAFGRNMAAWCQRIYWSGVHSSVTPAMFSLQYGKPLIESESPLCSAALMPS